MERLVAIVRRASKKKGTYNTYDSYARTYEKLCAVLRIDPAKDITEFELCAVCLLFCHSHSVNSLTGFLSGVEQYRRGAALPPLPRFEAYKEMRAGLTNVFGRIDKVTPAPTFSLGDLVRIRLSLDLRRKDEALFWCMLVLGIQGLLRAGEMVAGRLRWGDIEFVSDGLRLTIPFSKSNPHPVDLFLVRRSDWFCPCWAIEHLRSFLVAGPSPSQGIYTKSYSTFNSELKRRCKRAGITKAVTSHSLRRTGATMLFDAGVPEAAIMAHGRWVSTTWRRYLEFGEAQQRRPTATLLRAHQRGAAELMRAQLDA